MTRIHLPIWKLYKYLIKRKYPYGNCIEYTDIIRTSFSKTKRHNINRNHYKYRNDIIEKGNMHCDHNTVEDAGSVL